MNTCYGLVIVLSTWHELTNLNFIRILWSRYCLRIRTPAHGELGTFAHRSQLVKQNWNLIPGNLRPAIAGSTTKLYLAEIVRTLHLEDCKELDTVCTSTGLSSVPPKFSFTRNLGMWLHLERRSLQIQWVRVRAYCVNAGPIKCPYKEREICKQTHMQREDGPVDTLVFMFLTSRSATEYISVVLSYLICDNLLQ